MSDAGTANQVDTTQRVSVLFQIVCIFISVLWIGYLSQERLAMFQPGEQASSEIIHITPPVYRQFGSFANFVTVGLYIDQFHTFDITNNAFVFSGYVWFKSLAGILSSHTLEQFSFIQGDIIERSPAEVQIENNQMLTIFHIKAKFSCPLNYKDFPFDDHRLRITLTLKNLSPEDIVLQSRERNFIVKPDVSEHGWHKIAQDTDTGYLKSSIDTYDKRDDQDHPAAMFIIDYDGFGYRFVIGIFLPLFLIFFITLFGFSLDYASALRNAIGAITGLLGYRFVIDHISPNVAYFMISDYIFFLILILTGIVLTIYIVISYQFPNMSAKTKSLLLIILHLLLDGFTTYFLFM